MGLQGQKAERPGWLSRKACSPLLGVWPALRLSSPCFLPTAEEKKEEKKEESEESDDDMGFGLFD